LSLVTMLASILASKLHEGWIRINSAELGPVLKTLQLPKEHVEFRRELKKVIEEGLLAKIRNTSGFHYPAGLDFTKLTGIDETDTVIYGTEGAYNGDLFSNVSALAAIDSLISHNDNTDWRKALTSVWNGVTDASGRYCIFISEMVAVALNAWLPNDYIIERLELTNAPALTERPLVFFAHLPD